MREELLHFIWQNRYFNYRELRAESGEPLIIHCPGDPNTDQGPDFRNARIAIGETLLEGPVELHLRTTDWVRHGHTGDPHYKNVILHVVWENDCADPPDGIPVLALHDRIPKTLLPRYRQFMSGQTFVPCEPLLSAASPTPPIAWPAFRQTLLLQRLGHRTEFIRSLIDENNPHWEETIFQLIARSLGQPINTGAFLAIAQSFTLSFLLRRRTDPATLESLFKAAAARLGHPLSFSRMRPAHQPPVRLAQLAALLTRYTGWFTILIESDHPAALLETLDVEGLGIQTKHSILINAHIPLLYAYSIMRQETRQRDKALRWLESIPAESNSIIRHWRELGFRAVTAADTQALLELKKNWCTPKECLDCAIGQTLLAANPGASLRPEPASENLPLPPYRDGYCT
jgi:hypothetical protein